MKKLSLRALLMAAFLLAGLMATASPALADLDAGAGSVNDSITGAADSDGDSETETTPTEDTDTNDDTANNVEDDGDNAHPSGNDRSVESGGSGNQGSAASDPDDDGRGPDRSNGGPDQPNGSGGVDEDDQDGNNGCGNDDDFEDDNEGMCRGPAPDNSCAERGNSGWECSEAWDDSVRASGSTTGCPNEKMGGDDTGHGANQGSVYDSTCDGSPSGNGNGSGSAKGKPCAGCVGNADDKNPPGQMPGGSDNNRGYECDENSGVGRTNPAHTGCTEPAELFEDEVQAADEVRGAIEGRTDKACPADATMADDGSCGEDDTVLGKVLQKAGPLGAIVKQGAAVLGAVLPFTGNGDLVAFLVIAVALIAGGLLLMKRKTA